MVLRELRKLFSRDVIFSLFKDFSFVEQTERSKKAFLATGPFLSHVFEVIKSAPYLFIIYFLVTWINIQYTALNVEVTQSTQITTTLIALILLTIANALTYVETMEVFDPKSISNPIWYSTKRSIRLLFVFSVTTVVIMIGLLSFIIPGVYLTLRLAVTAPACIIDDCGIRKSIRRSISTTKHQHTLIATIFSLLTFLFVPFLFALITLGETGIIIAIIVFSTISPPLIHITLALIYLNGKDNTTINMYP